MEKKHIPPNGGTRFSSVSFFCPAYKEPRNLRELIPQVHEFLSGITSLFEILIIEDGSPDETPKIADALAREFTGVRVIHHSENLGYGIALRDGFLHSRYDYVMYVDSDNQYKIEDLKVAIPLLESADVVSCYVRKKALSPERKLQSWVFNTLVRVLFAIPLKDVNCSMKIYKRKVLDAITIKSTSAFIDAEMLIRARRAGFKIAQFPITHYARTSGLATGSKPSVIISTFLDMLKFRFGIL